MTAQEPKVQHFESTTFQDPQTAAAEETSGTYYYGPDGKSGLVGEREVGKLEGKGRRVGKKFPAKNH
jgi:hypothetical protein